MREIKFRAFNGDNEFMLENVMPVNDRVCILVDRERGSFTEDWGEYEYMQYTGLSDKNGVEIYEGDIVSQYPGKQWEHRRDIRWLQGKCAFWMYSNGEPHLDLGDYRDDIEVIGNIYENPELHHEG